VRKLAYLTFALTLLLTLAGCGGSKMPYDLEGTARIEIRAYDGASNEPYATVVVDGAVDVDAIVEHFSALPLKQQKNVEPSVLGYELFFHDHNENLLAKLSLPYGPTPWIDCSGDSYMVTTGAVDVEYLAQLVNIAVSTGPKESEESASFTGFISEIYPETNSLYIRTDPEHGFDAAYSLTVYLPAEYPAANETKTSWVDITYTGEPVLEERENEDGEMELHAILQTTQILDFVSFFVD